MIELIQKVKKYFDIKELVCNDVYRVFKEGAWYFFDEDLLKVLLWVRETVNRPILINNWYNGGQFSQRGLRSTCCQLVKDKANKNKPYVSAHILGKGVDFDVKDWPAQKTRDFIEEHKDSLPCNIRLEKGVNWVHMDTRNYTDDKIQYF